MLYGTSNMESGADIQLATESLLYDDIAHGTEEQIKEFCESEAANVLVERGVLKKGTLMRLSKADDEKRREKLMAYQLAKQGKDPLWRKLTKNRVQEKKLIAAIMKKYGPKARKLATVAQKEYIKVASKLPNIAEKR